MNSAAPVSIAPGKDTPVLLNPFPGLRPFREDEEHLFFGRESQVDAMVDKLAATHFLSVIGTSGSGKSSLVNCGLRPALQGGLMAQAGTAWRMAQFRPGSDPLQAMTNALAADGVLFRNYQAGGLTLAEIVETTLRMSKLGLIDIYEQAQLDKDVNLLVVVDQFEELFRYRQLGIGAREKAVSLTEETTAFVNLLLEAKNQTNCPIYVVLTMRSDFLGDCAEFAGLVEAINAGQYLVPRMSRDERRAAIAGPVGVAGMEISPVLLTRLVNDVGDNPDQLSILQHALNRTWALWQHKGSVGPLDLAHYEAIGTMAHALDQHAERAYAEMDTARKQRICEKTFKALTDKATDPRGVRRPTTLGTLCALSEATGAEVTEVIDVFRKPSRSFLMPPAGEELETKAVVDISHESLMRVWERLKRWADEEAQSARTYRRLADTAALHATDNAGLWRDPDLQLALKWKQTQRPTPAWGELYQGGYAEAMEFLQRSKFARDTELAEAEFVRRKHRLAAILGVVILAAYIVDAEKFSGPIAKWLLHLFSHSGAQELLGAKAEELIQGIPKMLAMGLLAVPHFLAYLALAFFGERVFRKLTYNRILDEIAARTTADAREGYASLRRATEPRPDAVIALGTSYAHYGKRAAGVLLSLLWLPFWLFVTAFFGGVFMGVFFPGIDAANKAAQLLGWFYALFFAVDWFYSAFMISSSQQATLGKRVLGMIVTDTEGNRVTFGRASLRHFAKLLCVPTIIGALLPFFSKKRQALHDLIAGTVVLRRPSPPAGPPPPVPRAPEL